MARKTILAGILDILFPPRCPFCRGLLPGGAALCPACEQTLPWTPPEHSWSGAQIARGVSPLWYRDHVKESIRRYKFQDRQGYAGTYGALMARCVRERLDRTWDLVTWVPLSGQRKKERGYDQAMLLAMAVALELDDVAVETLEKVRDVPAQSGITDHARRQANVSGVYRAVDAQLIAGKEILLVDDVVTSGSTLSECARTLLEAGARKVVSVTLARAEN